MLRGAYDNEWQWIAAWEPAIEAVVHAEGVAHTVDGAGIAHLAGLGPGQVEMYATAPAAIRSSRHGVTIKAASPDPTRVPDASASPSPSQAPSPSPTAAPVISPSPSPSLSPSPPPDPPSPSATDRQQMAEQALAWLRAQQEDDGSIGGPLVTAWSAIAFGSGGVRATAVSTGGKSLAAALADAPWASATDVERYVLAVRAAGHDPRSFGGRDAVTALLTYVKDGQIGVASQVNDDIFGVLALLAAGQDASEPAVTAGIRTILTAQAGGSWESVDMTAAAVQALRAYASRGGIIETSEAAARARAWLRGQQDKQGGFGHNSASTSWAVQAIVALAEDPAAWRTDGGANPWHALAEYQEAGGGLVWQRHGKPSPFMTAYAVPALLGQAWPIERLAVEQDVKEIILSQLDNNTAPRSLAAATTASEAASRPSALPPSHSPDVTVPPRPQRVLGSRDEETAAGAPLGESTAVPAPVVPAGGLPVSGKDKSLVIILFGIANTGVGIAVSRLVARVVPT